MVISPTFDFSRAISSSRSSRSRSFRAVAAPESARSRHSVSLAMETFVSRATSSNGSPRNNRATTANLRLTEKRFGPFPSTPEGAPTPALGERAGAPSGLRPSSLVMSNTPVEVQFTSAGCLNYPCRTPDGILYNLNKDNLGKNKWDPHFNLPFVATYLPNAPNGPAGLPTTTAADPNWPIAKLDRNLPAQTPAGKSYH